MLSSPVFVMPSFATRNEVHTTQRGQPAIYARSLPPLRELNHVKSAAVELEDDMSRQTDLHEEHLSIQNVYYLSNNHLFVYTRTSRIP